MNNSETKNRNELSAGQIWISGILLALIGLCFRLYHLGFNGFWFDEIGVANVIHANNLLEVLRISKSHVMAMPLDYFVAYLVSKLGQSEFLLRLPSAIWGSFSILVLFRIVYRVSGKTSTAALTAFLLVVSPIHIQYSQELRFYSSLVFFFLFCFARLMDALENPSNGKWMIYFASMVIGCYFHLYVALVVIPGFLWLLIQALHKKDIKETAAYFLMTNVMLLLLVISGVLFLTSNQHIGTTYENIIGTVFRAMMKGLGFIPQVGEYSGILNTVLIGFLILLFILGLSTLLRSERIWNQSLGWFIIITPILLIGMVVYKKYFILPRQFVFLVPFVLYTQAVGFLACMERIHIRSKIQKNIFLFICILLLTGLSFQGLVRYYQTPKTFVREIATTLIEQDVTSATVFIFPDWDVGSYLFYYDRIVGGKYPGKLIGLTGLDQSSQERTPGSFLIYDAENNPSTIEELESLGYRSNPVHHALQDRADILWKYQD